MELTVKEVLERGIAAHKAGDLPEAERLYKSILSVDPQHSDANHNLGVLAVGVGKVEEALPFFKAALEKNHKQDQYWLSYIDALIKLGQLDNARSVLERGRSIGLNGDQVDQLEEQAGKDPNIPAEMTVDHLAGLYNQGRFEDALKLGAALEQQSPDNPEIPNIIGIIYRKLSKNIEAISNFNKAIALKPGWEIAYNNLGNVLQDEGKYEEAIRAYDDAIAKQPLYAEAYYNLANVFQSLKQYDEAICNYRKAIELKPYNSNIHYNLGNIFLEQKKNEQAIICYRRALELEPCFVAAYNNLGNALQELSDYEMAIICYRHSTILKDDFAEGHANLGDILRILGQYEKAIAHFDLLNDPASQSKSLECLYSSQEYMEFNRRLRAFSGICGTNIRMAAVSAFVAHQLKQKDPYTFCKQPLNFFHVGHLSKYVADVKTFADDIILEAETEGLIWEPENKTTKEGFQTSPCIFEAGKNCILLKKIIQEEINFYHSKFLSEDCSLIKCWPPRYDLKGWYVRLIQHGYQESHIHPSGWVSGVIYLKTVDPLDLNEGSIELSLHGYELPILNKNYPKKMFKPSIGDIIVFPSSLFHKTIPFTDKSNRCVIAFDLCPITGQND